MKSRGGSKLGRKQQAKEFFSLFQKFKSTANLAPPLKNVKNG